MREKQHPKATKNTCVVTALSRTQDRDQLQEHNRWSPSQPQPTRNIFYSQGNISSHPTNTTAAKNPCLFLFCITFNICGTRALRSDTCVRARWRCYREIPPPPKYLQATAGAGVSVSGAKVCRSRSWLHLRPQLLGYRSLCTTS